MKRFLAFLLVAMLGAGLLVSNASATEVWWEMGSWSAWGRLYDDGTYTGTPGTPLNPNPYLTQPDGAQPLPFGTYEGPDGVEDSFGIALVDWIAPLSDFDNHIFESDDTKELTVFFYGADDVMISADGTTLYTTDFKVDVYMDYSPDFITGGGPGARTGIDTYTNVTDGTKVLSLVGHTIHGVDGDYEAEEDGNPVTGAFTGSLFLDVVEGDEGGIWAANYDTDQYEVVHPDGSTSTWADVALSFSTQADPGQPPVWTIRGTGEAQADVVPEPATLMLFGFGLLGLAGLGRRREN